MTLSPVTSNLPITSSWLYTHLDAQARAADAQACTALGPLAFHIALREMANSPNLNICDRPTLRALRETNKEGAYFATKAMGRQMEASIREGMHVRYDQREAALGRIADARREMQSDASPSPDLPKVDKVLGEAYQQRAASSRLADQATKVRALVDWNHLHDRITTTNDAESLPHFEQTKPLFELGKRIANLPLTDRPAAMARFRETVEALPRLSQRGLLGLLHEAKGTAEKFSDRGYNALVGPVWEAVLQGDNRFSYDKRSELAADFGIPNPFEIRDTGLRCLVEDPLLGDPRDYASPVWQDILNGETCTAIVEKYDLRGPYARLTIEKRTLGGYNQPDIPAPAKQAFLNGMSKEVVATRYGIQTKEGLALLRGLTRPS